MKQLVRQQYRAALWVLVLIALVTSSLAAVGQVRASSANYTLTGFVEQGSGNTTSPVPAGVQVDLISRATGQVFTTTTACGGSYSFTSSNTGGALTPGYWGVWVPAQGNISLPGCGPTHSHYQWAVLPTDQNPVFRFENATALTTYVPFPSITGVNVLPYIGNITGTVYDGGQPAPGAQLSLIDPVYNGFAFVNNTTSLKGTFQLNAPLNLTGAPWVLKTTVSTGTIRYNLTEVYVTNRTVVTVDPHIQNYVVSGYSNLSSNPLAHVPTAGNVTLWDPTNHYLYSSATPVGGYYSAGTYPAGFTSGPQTFNVILSSIGYSTVWYPLTVTSPIPYQKNVLVSPLKASQFGRYQTVLDFSALNTTAGKGSLWVNSSAVLGNDTVVPYLPNATVGQLWAQLGLDFDHSVNFSMSSFPAVLSFLNSTGPFFPAVQAGMAVNGTGFLGPTTPQTLASWTDGCSGLCGLSDSANLTYRWSQSYALNGTVLSNSSTYSISFAFAHPVSSSDVYNYTIILPSGYVLAANTQAPSATKLSAAGMGDTWTRFTLQSLPSTSPVGSATFSIVKAASLVPIVNVTVPSYFAFSKHNVLNSTQNNYTVEVGVNQNATFSAVNSIYPAGTNGTRFVWTFGDGGSSNTTNSTTNHTYKSASGSVGGSTPFAGTLTVTSSGGMKASTKFFVWVARGPVTAKIAVNSTSWENRTAGSTPYVYVNWSRVLQFNATLSSAAVSPSVPVPAGVLSVASFTLVSSHGFKVTANYSVAQNAYFGSNFTYQFLGAGNYLSAGTVNGAPVTFFGWQYNLTLTVWSGTGQTSNASLVILVNDTEKPISAFQLDTNSAGTPITGSSVVAGTNLSAKIFLNGKNATDPHNGSITNYYWLVTNSGNSSIHKGLNTTTAKPYPGVWLAAATTAYKINLTVTDRNGNKGWTTQSLTVSQNTATSPIMAATNLTGPSSLTDGSTYTYWVNVTAGGGSKSVAMNVTVGFYLLSSSGTGSRNYIGGSPASVKFFNYTSGVLNATPWGSLLVPGTIPSLPYNTTVRAEITWTPAITGNFILYVNVTASNEFVGDYQNGPNVKTMSISIGPNPTTQLLEYVAIGVAVVVVLALIIIYYRRRSKGGEAKGGTSRSGIERPKRPADEDDEDEK